VNALGSASMAAINDHLDHAMLDQASAVTSQVGTECSPLASI